MALDFLWFLVKHIDSLATKSRRLGWPRTRWPVFFEKGHRFPSPLFTMAAGAMNAHVGPSSFSAYQLAFGHGGGILDDEKLLEGVDVRKAFDKMVKERERASIAFEKERAAERF